MIVSFQFLTELLHHMIQLYIKYIRVTVDTYYMSPYIFISSPNAVPVYIQNFAYCSNMFKMAGYTREFSFQWSSKNASFQICKRPKKSVEFETLLEI